MPGPQSAGVRISTEISRISSVATHAATRAYADRLADLLTLVAAHHALQGDGQGGHRTAYALNRAALVVLTGHFQGFAVDLFEEAWQAKYPGSVPARLTRGLSNPWPREIDALYESLGRKRICRALEPRTSKTSVPESDLVTYSEPTLVRAGRTRYQLQSVVGEMVAMRNQSAHGGMLNIRLRDVTNYLVDTVVLALTLDSAV